MKPTTSFTPTIVADPPETPTFEDKRTINRKLGEVYINEHTGYADGWSDKKVADTLGYPVAWVADIRERDYGPVRINEEAVLFAAKVQEMNDELFQISAQITDAARAVETLRAKQKVLVDNMASLLKTARTVEKLY